jgi:hypothetical protein
MKESEVLKIEESESQVVCADCTALRKDVNEVSSHFLYSSDSDKIRYISTHRNILNGRECSSQAAQWRPHAPSAPECVSVRTSHIAVRFTCSPVRPTLLCDLRAVRYVTHCCALYVQSGTSHIAVLLLGA